MKFVQKINFEHLCFSFKYCKSVQISIEMHAISFILQSSSCYPYVIQTHTAMPASPLSDLS